MASSLERLGLGSSDKYAYCLCYRSNDRKLFVDLIPVSEPAVNKRENQLQLAKNKINKLKKKLYE